MILDRKIRKKKHDKVVNFHCVNNTFKKTKPNLNVDEAENQIEKIKVKLGWKIHPFL